MSSKSSETCTPPRTLSRRPTSPCPLTWSPSTKRSAAGGNHRRSRPSRRRATRPTRKHRTTPLAEGHDVTTTNAHLATDAPGPIQMPAALNYSSALPRTTRVFLLAVVTLVTCMEFLTSYAIGVALPDIQGDLSASFDQGSWILTTYSTCFLIGLVLSDWLATRTGSRRHLAAAIVLYTFSAIGCSRSQTLTEMIVFRAAMGYAGGTFLVRAQTAINLAFAGKARAKALGVFALGVVGVARLCGA